VPPDASVDQGNKEIVCEAGKTNATTRPMRGRVVALAQAILTARIYFFR
jgi:hypothetical protein